MAIILALLSCAAQKPLWGDPDSGFILSYRATGEEAIEYQHNNRVTQELEMMGYPVKTVTDSNMVFSVIVREQEEDSLSLHITLDHFSIDVSNPPQSFSPDTSHLAGKSFSMALSPQGKESDLSEAQALTYVMAPGATSSLKSTFDGSFPDLPIEAVRIGGAWPSTDDLTSNDNNTRIHLLIDWINTLVGIETVSARECVRISSKASGTIEGEGFDPGLGNFTFKGDVTGSANWLFAYKEGTLAEAKSEFASDIAIENPMGEMPVAWAVANEIKRTQ